MLFTAIHYILNQIVILLSFRQLKVKCIILLEKLLFRHQQELNDHLKEHHQIGQETDDVVDLPQIQKSCPVCHKVIFFTISLYFTPPIC